jgi:hypothetical protein
MTITASFTVFGHKCRKVDLAPRNLRPGWRDHLWSVTMLQHSRYMNGGLPKVCANCFQPFAVADNQIRAWHGQDGRYYCGEDCEADTLEAKARRAKVFS